MDTLTAFPRNQAPEASGPAGRKRWFDAFIADSIDPIIAFDERLNIKFINQNGIILLGKKEDELLGANIETCGRIGSIIKPALLEVLQSKGGMSCDHEILDGDKNRIFQASYSPVFSEKQEVIGVFSILREMTDRRTLLRHLAATNKRLETQAKALEVFDVVSESDLSGQILYANDKFCTLSGYSRVELVGQNYRLLNSGYHSKAFFQDMWRTISRGRIWFGEFRNKGRDGSLFWVQTIITPMLNEEGKLTRFLTIQRDITQESDRRVEAEDFTFHFRQILDSSPVMMASLDLDRNILFCNKAFIQTTGRTEKEILKSNWLNTFVPFDQKQTIQEELLHLLGDQQKTVQFQAQLFCKNGDVREIFWRASVVKDPEGVAFGIHLLGEEIAERSSATLPGNSKEDLLLQKRDVMGFVSHELLGGLTSIHSGLETIQSDTISRSELKETARKVFTKLIRLERVSRNLLENFQKGSRPIHIQFQSISLRTLLRGVGERFREDLPPEKNLKFILDVPEQDIIVQWDPLKIEEVLANLLRNAVQYSKPEGGEITLRASQTEDKILVSVSDQGIGVPLESIESIFNLFTRGSNTEQREVKNFGMGLKFCRDIVLKHHGRIWVESKLGLGTTFHFLVPIDPKEARLSP